MDVLGDIAKRISEIEAKIDSLTIDVDPQNVTYNRLEKRLEEGKSFSCDKSCQLGFSFTCVRPPDMI